MASETMEIQEAQKQEVAAVIAERTRQREAFVPRADIYETDDSIVVMADMPGVDENSVDITLEKDVLNIEGHVDSNAPENYFLAYAEYRQGDYQRKFSISNQIDQEGIEATVKDGVLRLFLPKADRPASRRIAVASG
ncbi:MAG: Hsp20/alpha crystallin family protein [Anaerolineae bacterium]|nr:Hsp20/alpha crystallin family protein [Anaerolineae bacterium]